MLRKFTLLLLLLPLAVFAAQSPFEGRWRLDRARSTALDGWSAWDLVVHVDGDRVSLQHDLQWYATKFSATNTVTVGQKTEQADFFRVAQRHMAVYPAKNASATVNAAWLDDHRTLRVEAEAPVETSQGNTTMRIYSEYRVAEGDHELVLIELHHSRPTPLVYHFTKVDEEK